ncbi:uncharacterized protein B0I36DRAFT_359466 [Microdochium trichocladiopsis]|uniref:CENP-V/GFA domain-containing protein n=1 Tax=Microdochium trichocladiopsis TaxID=1682393 RepID=A0A9P9BUN7_9PEZI|nr:uncharacterized protein B0I36DRAFT_359466 [Microdochium trichocladiopsis]KAH7037826.1 hypothetical protein B0I36DRAFT_359466 [Microdochium trichocladiopsis]
MGSQQLLRGSCFCGRNQYVIQIPKDSVESAQVLFDSSPGHRIASASPLSAFIRVPLSWYHSRTFPFFPDETRSGIRRVYSHPAEQHAHRHFCGFCGTPLSYWSESPRREADYIRLTLGSLLTDDLHDLEEMGLIPVVTDTAEQGKESLVAVGRAYPTAAPTTILRDFTGIPWFDNMLAGSTLGSVQTRIGFHEHDNGRVRVEWEVTEWTEGGHNDEDADMSEESSASASKRKRAEADYTMAESAASRRVA